MHNVPTRPGAGNSGLTPHDAALGVFMIDGGPQWAEFCLEWRDELMARADFAVPASAPIISVMESACNYAIWSSLKRPLTSVPLSLRVDHFRPAIRGRRLIGRAECFRITKRIAFARGVAHDGDQNDPIANIAASFFYTKGD